MSETNNPQAGVSAQNPAQLGNPLRFLSAILDHANREKASDIHLRTKAPPILRVDGVLRPVNEYPMLTLTFMEELAQTIMAPSHWDQFQEDYQVDLSIGLKGIGRVRVNVYYQRGSVAMALRVINTNVPKPDELRLPDIVNRLVDLERGLVIFTGATGSGKSTSLASLINEINDKYAKHILTIEDPIEFLFTERRSIISQREIGVDANNFAGAMRATLREDPDVILLGEMRDYETMEIALTAAETGHLVFTTLHAPAAAETITRMISVFPATAQPTIRSKIAQNLYAVVAQRLLPRHDGEGRVVATEVMTVSALIRELILDPLKGKEINDMIKKGSLGEGMLSFDESLFMLCRQGEISEEVALDHASSPTDLRLKLDGF
ncbi:MAG: PilT/PilU family type 4a pilus ATPase [Gammaproteobacteria bacterium]|nr:PilT/PilU family type 4a pilus ATPase [Gammaproteobacteria bacterium]